MKNTIRNRILTIRNNLAASVVNDAEKQVFNHLIHMNIYQSAHTIMVYVDFKNEIQTKCIMQHISHHGKKLTVPLTERGSLQMWPIPIDSIDELTTGNFGILEPPKHKMGTFDIDALDLVIVPGVVFDGLGNRIGFGKGYYDTFLSSIKREIPFVALAYDFQVLDHIPSESHDIKMDYIITPSKIINCSEA